MVSHQQWPQEPGVPLSYNFALDSRQLGTYSFLFFLKNFKAFLFSFLMFKSSCSLQLVPLIGGIFKSGHPFSQPSIQPTIHPSIDHPYFSTHSFIKLCSHGYSYYVLGIVLGFLQWGLGDRFLPFFCWKFDLFCSFCEVKKSLKLKIIRISGKLKTTTDELLQI